MLKIERTDSNNNDFIALVKSLDAYLKKQDGEEHSFYAQYNKIGNIDHVIVVYMEAIPVGCGAIKEYNSEGVEVKRMYVSPEYRGQKIATTILSALEKWAREMKYRKCVLETGKRQPEAVSFYRKSGYSIIPNYGQYVGVENSLCFEKILNG